MHFYIKKQVLIPTTAYKLYWYLAAERQNIFLIALQIILLPQILYWFQKNFFIVGKDAPVIPDEFKNARGFYYVNPEIGNMFIEYLKYNFEEGYNVDPIQFNTIFERYDGK